MPAIIIAIAIVGAVLLSKRFTAGPLAQSLDLYNAAAADSAAIKSSRPWLMIDPVGWSQKERDALQAAQNTLSMYYGMTIGVDGKSLEAFWQVARSVWKASGYNWFPWLDGIDPQNFKAVQMMGMQPLSADKVATMALVRFAAQKQIEAAKLGLTSPKVAGLSWSWRVVVNTRGGDDMTAPALVETSEMFIANLRERCQAAWEDGA